MQRQPARRELAIAETVGLERLAAAVGMPAVELDDEAVLRPDEVRLIPIDDVVGHGARQVVVVEEGEEGPFEGALGDTGGLLCVIEDRGDGGGPPAPGVARDEGTEGEWPGELAVLRLVEGGFDVRAREYRGEVERGA